MTKKEKGPTKTPASPAKGRLRVAAKSSGAASRPQFPVVGIGASAGGLEACTALLKALPVNPGMAFVVVQHLDPHHESILHKLLSKTTEMPVLQVEDGMVLEPNHVYVIPPNHDMAVRERTLRLMSRRRTAGRNRQLHLVHEVALVMHARDEGAAAVAARRDVEAEGGGVSALLFLAQTVRIAIPYLFAAAGGAIAERAGVVSLTLEGFMLGGAFGAVLGAHYTGSAWLGIVSGIAAGLLLGAVHAVASIRFKADQVVVGVAINLFAVGITRFFLQLAFQSSSNSPRVVGFGASAGGSSAAFLANPLVWLVLAVMPTMAFVINKTRFGLRVRAVGEHPQAAASVGVPVNRVRYAAVIASGALAALGGVY